jgi:hypothetical protein
MGYFNAIDGSDFCASSLSFEGEPAIPGAYIKNSLAG